jgi:hypothetical protein
VLDVRRSVRLLKHLNHEANSLSNGNCCSQAWLLKNSTFLKTAEICGIENVYANQESRLWGFLMQSFFGHFLVIEFFNSHRRYHNFAPFVRQTGEKKAQACAMGILQQLSAFSISVTV